MPRLTLTGLKKAYDGKQVLHGVDAVIEDGQFVVIVGPSGCGKSTLLRMIAGLEDVTEGEIALDGQRLNEIDPAGRGCAMVFQNYALYPHMSVRENIGYPLKIAGVAPAERQRRVASVAEALHLESYLERRPAQLSGGQRQRVAMGRAMVREPSIFLFDEPLSNLDAKLRVTMRIEIKRLHRRLAATSIFVTHDQVEAMTLADLLIVMNGGVVEQIGSPVEVYRRPASAFVAGFMGAPAMNLMPAKAIDGQLVLDQSPGAGIAPSITNLADSQALTLGIRPEDIAVSDTPRDGTLRASVDLVEELGGSRIAHCTIDGQTLAVVLEKQSESDAGDTLHLAFPPQSLHAFHAGTGKRLDMAPAT